MTTTAIPLVLDVQGRSFPLFYGASFTQGELPMLAPSAGGGLVAQVSANPNDPTQLGLQNLTSWPWDAVMPDGSRHQIEPGRSARLMEGVTVQMGSTWGQIRFAPAPGQAVYPPPGGVAPGWNMNAGANDSGMGKMAVLPPELRGLNWGALWLNGVWAMYHFAFFRPLLRIPFLGRRIAVMIALAPLMLMAAVPILGPLLAIAAMVVLGVKGNEWAWQNRRFAGIEQFKATQKAWAIWGWVCAVLDIALCIYGFLRPYHHAQ